MSRHRFEINPSPRRISTMTMSQKKAYRISAQCRSRRPRGYLYIAVLLTTLIVMATVTAALTISTSSLRGERDRDSQGEALRLAEAELHRQAALMQSGTWRNDSTHNVFSDWRTITFDGVAAPGDRQVRHRLSDTDGDLADDLYDSVELTVHARVGSSEVAVRCELESAPKPIGLLEYSVTSTDDIQLEQGTLSCEQPVQIFDDCKTDTWGVLTTPRLELNGFVQPMLRGDLGSPATISVPQDIISSHKSRGTELLVPAFGSSILLQDIVLSAASNPYGSTNPEGIYWFDAGGAKVVISHCRLHATIAIENASSIEITGGVVWEYPTDPGVILATNSIIQLVDVESTLDETARAVNFNPAATPYRETLFNNNSSDVFPSELRGVVYTTNDFEMYPMVDEEVFRMTGAVICSDMQIEGYMTIRQLSETLVTPPIGLADPTPMRFLRGSFRRIPSP